MDANKANLLRFDSSDIYLLYSHLSSALEVVSKPVG